MVLIYSIETDATTNEVIDWLNFFKKKWKRINVVNYGASINFTYCFDLKKQKELFYNDKKIDLGRVKSVWLRRYGTFSDLSFPENTDMKSVLKIKSNIELENKSIRNLIDRNTSKKEKWLNHYENSSLSKIHQLEVAFSHKIKMPPTIITTKKKDLEIFRKKYNNIIIKPIESFGSFILDNNSFTPFTKLVDDNFFNDLDDTFYPILCQKYIEKEYEIRAFFLSGVFYSMAMFTQNSESTKIDSRNYGLEKQRRIPFELPKYLQKKLTDFMKKLDLNCGSIDLIKSTDSQIYFLEVNPVGQFGMISDPCNYNLEKKVAQYLNQL